MVKLEISTHTGDADTVEVKEFDAKKVTADINDETLQAISLGNNIYSRIDIKNIKPVENAE